MKKLYLLFSLLLCWAGAQATQYTTSYSLTQGDYVGLPARKAKFPFYVYGSESGLLSDFVASGFMGDTTSIKSVASSYDPTAPVSTGRTGKTSLEIEYKPIGRQGWAGIYWQTPANNWGKIKGAGFNLSGARFLSFWARGESGKEIIASAKVGGIVGPYPDSDSVTIGPIHLTRDWKQYKVDLKGQDLRHIIGGFMFMLRRADNPHGARIYFDEIVYIGDNDINYAFDSDQLNPKQELETPVQVPSPVPPPKPDLVVKSVEPKTVVVESPPKVIYVEKPVYIEKESSIKPEPIYETRFYVPTFGDFYFDLLRRAMEIQPSGYGFDIPLYFWAKQDLKKRLPQQVLVSEGEF